MQTYVALLYSIVLGAGRRVVMTDLRAMAADIGLVTPRTLVASGNLVFEAPGEPIAKLEARLEAAFAQRFGRHVDIIVRDAPGWRRLVDANPFRHEAEAAPTRVHVRIMRQPLSGDASARLEPYLTQGERIAIALGDLWMHFEGLPGQSKLLPCLTPRRMGVGTTRNWNTVRRIGEMVAS